MKHPRSWALALLGAALLSTAVACKDSAPAPSSQHAEADRPDGLITAKIKAKLTADPSLNPFEISVTTEQGVVSLTGEVEEAGDRSGAERLARETVGVRDVVNNITVKGAPDTLGEKVDAAIEGVGHALNDAAITASVKSKLLAAEDIAGLEIDVDTAEGVVVLVGKVKTRQQKQRAEELTRGTEGVKGVVNKLEVQH